MISLNKIDGQSDTASASFNVSKIEGLRILEESV